MTPEQLEAYWAENPDALAQAIQQNPDAFRPGLLTNQIQQNFQGYQDYLQEVEDQNTLVGALANEDLAYVPGSGSGGESLTDRRKAARSRAWNLGQEKGIVDPETGRFLDIGFDYVYDGMNVNTTGRPGEYAARVDTDMAQMVKPLFDAILTNIATQGLAGAAGFGGGVEGITNPLDPQTILNLRNEYQAQQPTEDVPPELQQGDIYGPGGMFDIPILDYPNAPQPPEQTEEEGGGSTASGGATSGGQTSGGDSVGESEDTWVWNGNVLVDTITGETQEVPNPGRMQEGVVYNQDAEPYGTQEEGLTLGQPDWWYEDFEPDVGVGDGIGDAASDSGGSGGTGNGAVGAGTVEVPSMNGMDDTGSQVGSGFDGSGTGTGSGEGEGSGDVNSTPLTSGMFGGGMEFNPFQAGISYNVPMLSRVSPQLRNYLAALYGRMQ